MAAGLGFKTFTTGEVLTAADTNGYLMQGILVFASAAARDAAITSPQEGQFAYLKDTNVTTYYTGSAWANVDTTGMTNPMTTTGDTIYSSSGSTPARLGIGSTGNVLTVAGGVPTWAAPAGAGGMTLITEQVLSSSTGYQFTGLGSYKQLMLVWSGLSENTSGDWDLRLNNDSTAGIYNTAGLGAYNGNIWQAQGSGTTLCAPSNAPLFTQGGYSVGNLYNSGKGYLYIDNYTSSTKLKTYWGFTTFRDGPDSSNKYMTFNGIFNDTAAITTLDIVRINGTSTLSNATNTSIRLYGIS